MPTPEIEALRQRAAGRGPVVAIGDKPTFQIATSPMDADWKARFDANNPTHDVLPASKEGLIVGTERQIIADKRLALINGLLGFAGERVNIPAWEDDLDAILERGQLFSPASLLLKRGASNRCHANSAELWLANREKMLIATGYYLSAEGGMWRQHSWCIELRPQRPRVVETTVPAVAYFGFVMTDAEATAFADENWM